ncbi:glutathione S-transferase [Legionella adelaidensis]|uniref:Glutathione S-transferase n=1 Tax=Legionella adelaidensis TaxID=45056 RepID=A0A0W0R6B0_9GAMM|nr:glutathione transferase GstA [Legionella adelaidensis]KTC66611.1 glutathione S-transferase [Legionella adelaidensis]
MKLYYTPGACSLTVRIIINELDLKTEFESVDLKKKKTDKGEDFLKINPKGSVPVLQLENGEVLTENAVILQYLADSNNATHLLPNIDNFNRYRILEWVNYITTELHKTFANLFNPTIPEHLKNEVFIPLIKTKFDFINKKIRQPYLMGNDFSLPDAYLYVIMRWAKNFNIDLSSFDKLSQFFRQMETREAVKKSLKEEKLIH